MSDSEKENGDKRTYYPKADMVHRSVARLVDVIIVLVAVALLPNTVSWIVGVAYLLLADGFLEGQSPGKRLGGVKVVNRRTRCKALYRESIIRNLPFAIVLVLVFLPVIGWILFLVAGLFVLAFELFMAWSDRFGLRIGDVLADTQVVDASVPIADPTVAKRAVPTTS